jgi:citrate lyase subunit alpha / citrate CoA-transferase
MKNAVGRELPEIIAGLGKVTPFAGAFAQQPTGRTVGPKLSCQQPRKDKRLDSIEAAIDAVELKDGMTISFHHHFRNGDKILNRVVAAIAKKGIRDITLSPSSLSTVNDALIPYIEQGVITAIETSGARSKLGRFLTEGHLKKPLHIRSHGGRARAIESGEIHIDVAFLGAPACDTYGNINGTQGPSACGSLGYALQDAAYADQVVAITDNLVPHPLFPISIPQTQVDYIVVVDSIGDASGIASGALRYTKDPKELQIARFAADVMDFSGCIRQDFSMQLGSGGASMAVGRFIKEKMLAKGITGSFGVGGVAGVFAEMMEQGLFKMMFDVQSFDIPAIESITKNANHLEMSASYYANPHNSGPIVNNLDAVILSATEVDVNFNVNVITDSNGVIMGASGGHSDTAAGAKLSIVVAPLLRGRLPMVRDAVQTVVTPGETVDVIVTERGIAVNPRRADLLDKLKGSTLPIVSIEDLQQQAYDLSGKPDAIEVSDDIVGVVEYRDGTLIDVIRKPL